MDLRSQFSSLLWFSVILFLAAQPPVPHNAPQTENGESFTSEAVSLLVQARESLLEEEVGEERDTLLGIIGIDLAELGQTNQARKAFALMTSDRLTDSYLRSYLAIRLKARDLVAAQNTVKSMKTLGGRAEGLCALASAQWKAGQHHEARQTLSAAESTFARHRTELTYANFLEPLASAQAELGDTKGAEKTKRMILALPEERVISDSWDPSWVAVGSESYKLLLAGRAETEKGNIEVARSTYQHAADSIRTVTSDYGRAVFLGVIAGEQAKIGDMERARSTFAKARDEAVAIPAYTFSEHSAKIYALRDIALAQASAGDINGSMVTMNKLSDANLKDQALHGIAVAQVKQKSFELGENTAKQIQTIAERDATFVEIAQYLGKEREVARVHLVVAQIHSPFEKALALREAAEGLGGVGYFSKKQNPD